MLDGLEVLGILGVKGLAHLDSLGSNRVNPDQQLKVLVVHPRHNDGRHVWPGAPLKGLCRLGIVNAAVHCIDIVANVHKHYVTVEKLGGPLDHHFFGPHFRLAQKVLDFLIGLLGWRHEALLDRLVGLWSKLIANHAPQGTRNLLAQRCWPSAVALVV
jgi:hypothetical protein